MNRIIRSRLMAITSIFISCLTIVNVQNVEANFIWFYELPNQPFLNPPTIKILSPMQNQTYNNQNINLNFTITKPETWIKNSSGKFTNGSKMYYVLGNITNFQYIIDGEKSQSTPINDISTIYSANPKPIINLSINLTLPEGNHNLKLVAQSEAIYRNSSIMDPLISDKIMTSSDAINFSIDEKTESTLFSTALVLSPIAILVSVLCVLYFKKQKRRH